MKLINFAFAILLLSGLSSSTFAFSAGEMAPDFALSSSTGKNVRLKELRGQVVLINFWASWCGPCRQEMPLLDGIYKKYSKLGFVILGVNVEQDNSKAKTYLHDVPVTFPILYDPKNELTKTYNVNAMPTTVIVDRNGKVRYIHAGYKPGYEDTYMQQIKGLLKE